ncbi:Helix-turn-helix domain-containing protein [Paenibacillus sp. UNCCL117]|uniref:response regulator transcription factor n=1 Tax=unclassified Paenibacillus TaxID=185978 RepID=UPI000891C20D|nr:MULTISPECIES: response regulator [unclassified Paenibacillus]SDD03227.1 Helix-turn-helix domain-containing protein [Paenibacillus sp. cl123]SFW32349.1 Helix-turn-helix domain-containing protein [Paenibacillus sp. UNCCL117]
MNWKIAFVDDEPLVRNHLRSLLDWEKEGFVLCGEAEDGLQALELIKSQQPDAVIVDMSMPGMNGLELTGHLLTANPRLKVIVLSSYDSFEYVRGSLSYGAVDYLLKHRLTSESLGAVIGKVRKQLEEREAESRVKEMADIALARSVLRDYLSGVETDLQPLAHYFSDNNASADKPRWVVMLAQLAHYDVLAARLQEQELVRYFRSVTDLCDQAAGGYPSSCTVAMDRGRWVMLLACGKERSEYAVAQWVAAKGARLESSLKLYMNLAATIHSSPILLSLDQSREAYRGLVGQLEGQSRQPVQAGFSAQAPYVTIGHEKRLLAAMEAADAREAVVIIEEMMGAEQQGEGRMALLERVSAELVQIAAKIARKADIPADWMVQELSIFQRPGLTGEQARATVCGIYTRLAEKLRKLNLSSGHSRHVRQALQLMAARYREGITLEETAERLGITPSYLSRLVKEETGRTFTELLTEHRVERSKQLLLEGDTPLKELHAKLGFSSNSYFIRVFKEATGETPLAYMQRMKGRPES